MTASQVVGRLERGGTLSCGCGYASELPLDSVACLACAVASSSIRSRSANIATGSPPPDARSSRQNPARPLGAGAPTDAVAVRSCERDVR
jgi:hypothetical protein